MFALGMVRQSGLGMFRPGLSCLGLVRLGSPDRACLGWERCGLFPRGTSGMVWCA
jgi:hypothetical protein